MWKLLVGFIVFAFIAMFVLKKVGGGIDMSGEKHSVETSAPAAESASAASAASAVPMAAEPASGAASH